MGKKYQRRVSNLIQRKITQLLLMESKDPRLAEVTITDVSVNRDTSRAEVYYSIIGGPEERAEVQEALTGAAGWMRSELAPTLRLRNIPELIFIYDPSLAHGAHIEELLDQLREEEGDHEDQAEPVGKSDPDSDKA
ncbi:MAG: 30S ribosome-binding factor RbfA [Anaerolineae bacterium]